MRVSELTGLKLSNINQPNQSGIRTAQIKTRKTNQYNLVVWSKTTDQLLHKYLGWRLCQHHPTDHLFIRTDRPSKNGLTTKTIERWVKQLVQLHQLNPDITPHSFRHGKAHHILNNGGTAIDVQTVLRHKNLNSSLHYMRLNQTKYIQRASQFLTQTQEKTTNFLQQNTKTFAQELAYNTNLIYTQQ